MEALGIEQKHVMDTPEFVEAEIVEPDSSSKPEQAPKSDV